MIGGNVCVMPGVTIGDNAVNRLSYVIYTKEDKSYAGY